MLTAVRVDEILARLPSLTVAVVGDLFLDRYLDLDTALTEPSLETGLDAYQVVNIRSFPGAAGTIINNLAALGVGSIVPVAVIGDDGEGYELLRELKRLGVDCGFVYRDDSRRTPTYTKPMLHEQGRPPRELNRLDIKNRSPLPWARAEDVLTAVSLAWKRADAVLVLDQVSEAECGVVTRCVREALAQLADADPAKFVLADSRTRVELFRSVSVKPNERECRAGLLAWGVPPSTDSEAMVKAFAVRCRWPVFCTLGEQGICVGRWEGNEVRTTFVPAYPVTGPIDIVGAGDSTSAGIACAVAAGATLEEAAAFGNLVASITIQQIGTTGTASPEQVRQRWREVAGPQ